jgi:hypothetical protein
MFPDDWSQKQVLRVTALAMAATGLAVHLAARAFAPRPALTRIDVADHSGTV